MMNMMVVMMLHEHDDALGLKITNHDESHVDENDAWMVMMTLRLLLMLTTRLLLLLHLFWSSLLPLFFLNPKA